MNIAGPAELPVDSSRNSRRSAAARAGRAAAAIVAFAAAYVLLQRLTFLLRFPPLQRTPVWTPGGLLLGVLVVTPPATWWRHLVGFFAGVRAVESIAMPLLDGMSAAAEVLRVDPDARVVFVSIHRDTTMIQRGLAVGALGYVSKLTAGDDLVPAVRAALRGERSVSV